MGTIVFLDSPHYRFSRSVVFVNDRRNVSSQILAFLLHLVPAPLARCSNDVGALQGDHSACAKPPVDFKTKVPLWPGLPRPGQAKAEFLWPDQTKAELLSLSQQEVLHMLNGHPVRSHGFGAYFYF